MRKVLLSLLAILFVCNISYSQTCLPNAAITTGDSLLCLGDSTTLLFEPFTVDSIQIPTPIVNNNGQDGNMFDITATNTIRIKYFEGNIANTPNATTEYYIYYKIGTHVGFESNSAAWTLLAGPISFNPNAPNMLTRIPYNLNMVIPAGQTYAFYLTNTSAVTNNNRYHNGTATGAISSTNADLTIFEGAGGAYPFGTFFNARPWEGNIIYDYPISYLWSTGATTSSLQVTPTADSLFSCVVSVGSVCSVEDTITIQVNNPQVSLGNDTSICQGTDLVLDAGNTATTYMWCDGSTTQTTNVVTPGIHCVLITDSIGCTASDSVVVNIFSLPVVIGSVTDTSICSNDSVIFTGGGALTYTWNNGVNDGDLYGPASTNDYIVTGTDINGCSNNDTVSVVVNSLPNVNLGADVVQVNPPALLDAGSGFTNYLWSNSDTTQTSSVSTNGTYFVTVTDANGCEDSDTITVTFTLTIFNSNGIESIVQLYPNPVDGFFHLNIQHLETKEMQIEIADINGRIIKNFNPEVVNGNFLKTYDVSSLSSGVFVLNVMANGNSTSIRFIKK